MILSLLHRIPSKSGTAFAGWVNWDVSASTRDQGNRAGLDERAGDGVNSRDLAR